MPDQLGLASAFGAAVKRVNVVEHVNEHIQPVILGAAKLLDFEAERGSFAFVDFLHERRELPDLDGHALGNLAGQGRSLVRLVLGRLPMVGGAADLRGEHLEVLNFFRGRAQRARLEAFDQRAVFEEKREDAEQGAQRDANAGGRDLPAAQGCFTLPADEIGQPQQEGVTEKKRPLGHLEFLCIVHRGQALGKTVRKFKQSPCGTRLLVFNPSVKS